MAHADIAQACFDGTLNVWNTSSNLARPDKSCETAHAKNTETTGVAFARDGYRIASRGGDDTVKCEYPSSFRRARLMPMGIVWDLRSIRKPVAVVQDMGNIYPETNIIFSPDDRSILTGLPGSKGGKGAMVFLSGDDLSEQRRIPIGEGSVVRVLWHSRINQVSGSCLLHCVVIDTLRSLRPCHQAPSTSSTPPVHRSTAPSYPWPRCPARPLATYPSPPPTSSRSSTPPKPSPCSPTRSMGRVCTRRRSAQRSSSPWSLSAVLAKVEDWVGVPRPDSSRRCSRARLRRTRM